MDKHFIIVNDNKELNSNVLNIPIYLKDIPDNNHIVFLIYNS